MIVTINIYLFYLFRLPYNLMIYFVISLNFLVCSFKTSSCFCVALITPHTETRIIVAYVKIPPFLPFKSSALSALWANALQSNVRGLEWNYVVLLCKEEDNRSSCMIFKWEICWAAGVSRSRAPLRNATRRGGRTRRATSRRLKMTAASPTPSTRRITTGPPETRPRRYTDVVCM